MPKNPLAEVFGYKIDDCSSNAIRHRREKLCPFNNGVPQCTKDSKTEPLGVCSLYIEGSTSPTVICPKRFREGDKVRWDILVEAAKFFFDAGAKWKPLGEVKLQNKSGTSAGNIDMVLVTLDENDKIIDFGAMEIQAVYITGNVREPFEAYMANPAIGASFDWERHPKYPKPDYLSSTRKRLMPQLISKGEILQAWKKKQAIVVDESFYERVPDLKEVKEAEAEVVWLIYSLEYSPKDGLYHLVLKRQIYTRFKEMLTEFAKSEAGDDKDFIEYLQKKLDREKNKGERERKRAAKGTASKSSKKATAKKPHKASSKKS